MAVEDGDATVNDVPPARLASFSPARVAMAVSMETPVGADEDPAEAVAEDAAAGVAAVSLMASRSKMRARETMAASTSMLPTTL